MSEAEQTCSTISNASSPEEIGEFWDTHSVADYWDQTQEVDIEVRAQRRHRVTVSSTLYQKIAEQARQQGLLPETLVNLWLAERLGQPAGEMSG
jgi:hypothetical protein